MGISRFPTVAVLFLISGEGAGRWGTKDLPPPPSVTSGERGQEVYHFTRDDGGMRLVRTESAL